MSGRNFDERAPVFRVGKHVSGRNFEEEAVAMITINIFFIR